MKMKSFRLIETKLVHFHRIFKNGGMEGESPEPLKDPPLNQPDRLDNAK